MTNKKIADKFRMMATLLEIKGANSFRVRAYNRAADVLSSFPQSVEELVRGEKLDEIKEISGIGETLAEKIIVLVETEEIPQLNELKKEVPEALIELTGIAGLGPKRVWALYRELGIKSMNELRAAASSGKVKELDGFGEKIEAQILADIDRAAEESERILWPEAAAVVEPLLKYLKQFSGVDKLEVAGSFRRRRETVGDLDILATGKERSKIIEYFSKYPEIKSIISKGKTKSSVVLNTGIQVDLRAVQPESFGAALQYFTGSKAHGIAIRNLAIQQGKKVNEYGIYKNGKKVAGVTEEEMYSELGLKYIEPELRENRGEIAAAQDGSLPSLIELEDIKGDLQCHTDLSDGVHTLEEMATAAMDMGYEYLAVTEHSDHIGIVSGLSEESLLKRFKEIELLNKKFHSEKKNFRLLKSAEVDILKDGSLAYSDTTLKQMDFVVIAIHSSFGLDREAQTKRILTAMENPHVHLLAHPTGRIIGQRAGYEIDLEQIIQAAANADVAIELNAHPKRLDLDDIHLKRAKELGVKIGLSSDAHSTEGLEVMKYGIGHARRGWLEANDVLNTLSWQQLK